VSLGGLIEELWPVSELLARRYDVGVRCDPGAGGALVLATSASRLREALTNLLVNAIKYSGGGGVVRLSVDDGEPSVVKIHITDNGPGISAELLPRLFIPFDRLGAESRDRDGMGLGLPLTRGLVEAMQGSLTVRSEVGVGSTFTVELRRALERQEGPMTGLDKAPSVHHQILLIDDNAANVGLIRSMIDADPRFRVRHARDVHDGLELTDQQKPALIIFGLSLRSDAELDAVRSLATAPRLAGVPIAVMGGDLAPTVASQLGEFGVEAFLAKPLELERVMRLLDDVASSSAGGGPVLMNPVERSGYGSCVDACPDRR
jgi:CheY-like chemotaxis protein/anti-sigma regulatory factor (Ser/Thr protein kinase)